jgi:hypothetical protein
VRRLDGCQTIFKLQIFREQSCYRFHNIYRGAVFLHHQQFFAACDVSVKINNFRTHVCFPFPFRRAYGRRSVIFLTVRAERREQQQQRHKRFLHPKEKIERKREK